MTDFSFDSLQARLDLILQGRKPHAWGRDAGLSVGAVSRLMAGGFPNSETMQRPILAERISLSWLVSGAGSPYIVITPATDAAAAATLDSLLRERVAPQIGVIWCESGYAIGIKSTATLDSGKAKPAQFDQIEVMAGALGHQTAGMLAGLSISNPIKVARVEVEDWSALASGWLGNVELSRKIDSGTHSAASFIGVARQIEEKRATYMQQSTHDADQLTQAIKRLAPQDHAAIKHLVQSLTKT